MARIIYPTIVTAIANLLKAVFTKNVANETVLKTFLNQQEIDLNEDTEKMNVAVQHDNSRVLLTRQSENARQLRDIKFAPVFNRVKGIVQFLKSFYKPNFKALGEWGITVLDSGKIVYPTDIDMQLNLFVKIKAKSDSYTPETNPLTNYLTANGIDLIKDSALVTVARENNDKFNDYAKKAEIETADRDLLLQPITNHLRMIGDYLKNMYKDNPKELGLWGYVVDNNTAAPKNRTTKLIPGEKITIKSAVIGGNIANIGKVDIHVYKGTSTTGTPIIVHPSEKIAILKGYSTITIVNVSLEQGASFTALVG